MNMIPRSRSLVLSEQQMLLVLDKIIANVMLAEGSDPTVDVIKRTQSDKAFHEAFVRWGLKLRSAQLNVEDVGPTNRAECGQVPAAPSSTLNSNGDGHPTSAAHGGQSLGATPLLLNEDDEGQTASADSGRQVHAPSSSPNGDGVGHPGSVGDDHARSAAPSPTHRDTGGQCLPASDGRVSRAVPYREPSSAELKGRLSVKIRVAERILTSLDTYAIGGKPIGDLTFAEARAALDDKVEKSAVLRQILRHAANVSPNQRIREVVNHTDLDEMIRKAKELVDVA